jgi:hypothetical protein
MCNIQPEKRLQLIYNEILEFKNLKKKLAVCGAYSKAYTLIASMMGGNFFQEVVWDVNVNKRNKFYSDLVECIICITQLICSHL